MKKKVYEIIVILKPDIDEESKKTLVDKFTELISKGEGNIVEKDEWGVRELATPFKKQKSGLYTIWHVECPPPLPNTLSQWLNINEFVIHYLLTHSKTSAPAEKAVEKKAQEA
ncbi:30S ribosomal protein S6 [Candidatus Margulisiibacteriota bacterium]